MSGSNVDLISPSNTKQYAPYDKVYLLVATKTISLECEHELFDVAVVDNLWERERQARKEGGGNSLWAQIDGHDGLYGIRAYLIKYKNLSPEHKKMLESGLYPVHYINDQ